MNTPINVSPSGIPPGQLNFFEKLESNLPFSCPIPSNEPVFFFSSKFPAEVSNLLSLCLRAQFNSNGMKCLSSVKSSGHPCHPLLGKIIERCIINRILTT